MAPLHIGHEALHLAGHVGHVDARAVKGAVADAGAQNLRLAGQAALGHRVGPFDHQPHGPAAQNGAVALGIEGFGRLFHHALDRGGAHGEKPRGDPGALHRAGGSLAADDDHPLAAAGADPVLGHAHRLGGGGTGPAHLHVGSLGLDELGEVGRSQGHHVEEQVAVELVVAVALAPLLDLEEPVGDLLLDLLVAHALHEVVVDLFQVFVRFDVELVVVIVVHLVDEGLEAGKQTGEDHPGGGLHLGRQPVAVGDQGARGGLAELLHQRDASVVERLDARGDGQCDGDVVVGLDAVLALEVEVAELAGELDHLLDARDVHQSRRPVGFLEDPGDVHVQDPLFFVPGERFDEAAAGQQLVEVVVVEDLVARTGQPHRGPGDDDRLAAKAEALQIGQGLLPAMPFIFGFQHLPHPVRVRGDKGLEPGIRFIPGRAPGGDSDGRARGFDRSLCFGPDAALPGQLVQTIRQARPGSRFGLGIHGRATQRVADGDVLEQVDQQLARSEFQKRPAAGPVDRLDRGNELHRRDELAHQQLSGGNGIGRVGSSGHVGHHPLQPRRAPFDPVHQSAQSFGGLGHQRGVKGAGKRQHLGQDPLLFQVAAEGFHRRARPADRRLAPAVLVGHLNLRRPRGPDQGLDPFGGVEDHHDLSRVALGGILHQPAAFDHQFHGVVEADHPGGVQGGDLAQAVADEIVRAQTPGSHQVPEGRAGHEHRRLGRLGAVERLGALGVEHPFEERSVAPGRKDRLAPVHAGAHLGPGAVDPRPSFPDTGPPGRKKAPPGRFPPAARPRRTRRPRAGCAPRPAPAGPAGWTPAHGRGCRRSR